MLTSLTATMLKTSRSYSRPKVSSSQRIAFLSDSIAWPHLAASPRRTEIAGDKREEVRGLRVRIDPFGPVTPTGKIAGAGGVAVRQQDGTARFVGADRHRVARHDVGAVEEPRDAAKALGLALRAVIAAG